MNRVWLAVPGLFCGLFWTSPGMAAAGLTLRDAIATGLRQDPGLQQAGLDLERARVALDGARSERLTYGGDVSVGNYSGVFGLFGAQPPNTVISPIANAAILAKVPVFTGWRITHQIGQAEAGVGLAGARAEQARQNLVWTITEAYWLARRAELRSAIRAEAVEKARQARDIARASLAIGRSSANELDRAEVSLLNEESDTLRAKDDQERARDQLASLLHVDLTDTALVESPGMPLSNAGGVPDFENALARARRDRTDMRVAHAHVAMQAEATEVARADRWPQIEVVGAYQHGNNPFIATSASRNVLAGLTGTLDARINLTYHLFDNGSFARNVGAKELELAAATESLRAAEQACELEVRQALRRLEIARQRIALGERSVALAAKNLKYVEGRFKFGYTLLTELNEARITLVSSRNQRVDALIDYQLAWAALHKAQGVQIGTQPTPRSPQ